MNNFLKSILIGSILSLFLCLIIFGITSHDSSNKTQIENSQNLETVFFLHISKNTVIQRDTIIEFPDLGGYGDDRVKLKGEHFFKATHSNLGYESKFDFEYLRDFIDLFSFLDSFDKYTLLSDKENQDITLYSQTHKIPIISLFGQNKKATISFAEYLEFKYIIETHLKNTHIHNLISLFDSRIKIQIATLFNSTLPYKSFKLNEAKNVIDIFNIIENNKPFSYNKYIEEVKQSFINQFEYDTQILLHNYTVHYNTVVNFDTEKNIENFKLNNYIKVPKNDNDVCFVKIPDNVQIDYSTIGEINFTFKGYTLDAYNCNEK